MKPKSLLERPASGGAIVLPVITAALAAAIFALDTVTASEVAAPVLYVAVVLMSVRFCERRGVILVCGGCLVLTIVSLAVSTHGLKQSTLGLINTAISLVIIVLTTYLVLKIESAKSQAKAFTEAQQLRDALIGSVSHELRTPLASILGGVSILAETPAVAKDVQLSSLTRGIRDEGVRLNSDIQNLLDAARITSHGLQSREDWTDPADIINSATERIRLRYPGHRFELQFGASPTLIHVDPVLVEQALGQILSNAAKFSPPGSTIHVSAAAEGGQFAIAVRDEGAGLTADEKAHLMEKFFRGQRHTGKIPGSGLGLWIANTFVSSSGGRIEAASPGEGQGTTMRLLFPITRSADDLELAAQEA
ncbi:MAG TPA: ATP-binding protein [Pseudolabrys sp.]|nr:ATP-binding protein [Pseudolabrys sp.]